MFDHLFDEFAYNEDSSPITTMNDDVSLAFERGEFFCIVINKISLPGCWSVWVLDYILDASASSLVSSTLRWYYYYMIIINFWLKIIQN